MSAPLREARRQPDMTDVPTIMMSTEAADQDVAKAYPSGANFYVQTDPARAVSLGRPGHEWRGPCNMTAEPDFDLLRQGFVPEMRDLLEKAAAALLQLEADPKDVEAVHELFRVVHTIKATAGMFDLPLPVELVHTAEDLLTMFDQILLWVDEIDQHGVLPVGSGEFVRDRAFLAGETLWRLCPRRAPCPAGSTPKPPPPCLLPPPPPGRRGHAACHPLPSAA